MSDGVPCSSPTIARPGRSSSDSEAARSRPLATASLRSSTARRRAIRCAAAIRDSLRPLGLEVRCGLHTGEVELTDGDVRGIAVHIGSRIAALAGAGEILVSGTVKDLVIGSGIPFEDRGVHELKGVPGEWRVHMAEL